MASHPDIELSLFSAAITIRKPNYIVIDIQKSTLLTADFIKPHDISLPLISLQTLFFLSTRNHLCVKKHHREQIKLIRKTLRMVDIFLPCVLLILSGLKVDIAQITCSK